MSLSCTSCFISVSPGFLSFLPPGVLSVSESPNEVYCSSFLLHIGEVYSKLMNYLLPLKQSLLNSHNSVLFPLCISCRLFLSYSQSPLCLWKSHLTSSFLPIGHSDLYYTNYSNISSQCINMSQHTLIDVLQTCLSRLFPFMSRMSEI